MSAEVSETYIPSNGTSNGRAKVWSTRIIACRNLARPYASSGMDKYLRHWPKVTQYMQVQASRMVTGKSCNRVRTAAAGHEATTIERVA